MGSFPGHFRYPTPRNGMLVLRCFQTFTFASVNIPNIYFLAPGGLFLAGQWQSGQGPACHWLVLSGAVSQVSLSV